ncbi:Uncharacterised protein [Grimontia hollisae]|uniref:Uncharacterized protein n=1 Tax=Grimontia hollisae TaxID=673 RepID=A0A377J8G3_GRIHO|nr:Uncharacterised protein [Grimontia hollisae]STO98968.1 Uncharacterised protein [Grimontia hollisae]STR61844.1 Uncharacterised protein [Grimontia hollisae]
MSAIGGKALGFEYIHSYMIQAILIFLRTSNAL